MGLRPEPIGRTARNDDMAVAPRNRHLRTRRGRRIDSHLPKRMVHLRPTAKNIFNVARDPTDRSDQPDTVHAKITSWHASLQSPRDGEASNAKPEFVHR